MSAFRGKADIGDDARNTAVDTHSAALLNAGEQVKVIAEQDARCLLLAAQPLNEPVVQYGPFVMNTREEIEQAIRDYQSGKLVHEKAQAFYE